MDRTSEFHLQNVSILIEDDKIVDVGHGLNDDGLEVVNLDGQYVSAGWIDMHVHCFNGAWSEGIDPDRVGYESGVTMLIDAGTSGADTVEKFMKEVSTKVTKVKALLNISKQGLLTLHELRNIEDIDVELAIQQAKKYPEFIVGFKLRASASVMGEDMKTPFIRAKEIQKIVDKPLMVHVGNRPPTLDEVLNSLDRGDIVTHCFNGKDNGLLVDGSIRKSALQARERGVIFDVGHGSASFNTEVANSSKELGFIADTISTDIYLKNVNGPVYSLAHCMSKMMEIGYGLEDTIMMVTRNVADAVKLDGYGSIRPGFVADLTIFKEAKLDSEILDSDGNIIQLHQQLIPSAVVIDGTWRETTYGENEHIY